MMKTISKSDLKPLIKETLTEIIRNNKEEFKEMISEATEDISLANAVKEGRQNNFVSEKRILKILDR